MMTVGLGSDAVAKRVLQLKSTRVIKHFIGIILADHVYDVSQLCCVKVSCHSEICPDRLAHIHRCAWVIHIDMSIWP